MSHMKSLIGLFQERTGPLAAREHTMNNHASVTAGITSTVGTAMATRSDIYARPDVDDMEYEGAGNHDAHFFARLLARVRPRRVL